MRTALFLVLTTLAAHPGLAEVHRFEKTFPAEGLTTLDVRTERGEISIVAGAPGQVVVAGTARVRVGWNVPADADALARAAAGAPPITRDGSTLALRLPTDERARAAVTLGYEVRVPPATGLVVLTNSGAVRIAGVTRGVSVKSGSGSVTLSDLGAGLDVESGSGAVMVEDVAGSVRAKTESGALRLVRLEASLDAVTGSGSLEATLTGAGDVSARTGSGSVRLEGVNGALQVETGSGHVWVSGHARGPWRVRTNSSGIDVFIDPSAGATLDLASRSGSVRIEGLDVTGTVDKRYVSGTVGAGGATVHVRSGSGSIRLGRAPGAP